MCILVLSSVREIVATDQDEKKTARTLDKMFSFSQFNRM